MSAPVTVVRITSLSYTGTTWINLLLACHDRGFALGPPDRVLRLLYEEREKSDDACRIHAGDCTFWPGFFRDYRPDGNFYLQLAEASGRDVIVINNPIPGGLGTQHLEHPDVVVRNIIVARDGRGTMASYMRLYPDADFVEAVRDWFLPSARNLAFDRDDPDVLSVNYEHVVEDQFEFVRSVGEVIGVEYPDGYHRFWEFDHHTTVGNAGVLGVIRRHQGTTFTGPDAEMREANYRRMIELPEKPLYDERWKAELGRRERLVFGHYGGAINARWGYPRDRFTMGELETYGADLQASLPALLQETIPPEVEMVEEPLWRRHPRLLAAAAAVYVVSMIVVAIAAALIF